MSGASGLGRKRGVDPISMSFLDVISCGFGAVILLFMLMKHAPDPPSSAAATRAETQLLEQDIRAGQANLVEIRNAIAELERQVAAAQGLASEVQEQVDTSRQEIAERENSTLAQNDALQALKADIASLQAELERLRATQAQTGSNARAFLGNGKRQYLTGMYLGGERILILVDVSASMLDATIVNIVRRRNMSSAQQLDSPKWQQVLRTVDWLSAQLPPTSRYQLYTFNDQNRPILSGSEGRWLDVADSAQLQSAIDLLKSTVPSQGTNLELLFQNVAKMDPRPDNIFLITDGLPTLGVRGTPQNTISGREREALFERAVRELPPGIPVNVILAPLEGDPAAASWYWQLAMNTGGSFLEPSADWP
ncbi:MAG: VWA domain-containing protein [Pseudomonadales bacterium]|jgi:hypothetical protein|nr:VWA domain-containing protein [Pseudomonadales bacterium]